MSLFSGFIKYQGSCNFPQGNNDAHHSGDQFGINYMFVP